MSELKFETDYRQRALTCEIDNRFSVCYDIKQKTGNPVESIIGSINKNGNRIGTVSVDKKTNSFYISFEKLDSVDVEEREAVFKTINQNIEQIFKLE